MRTSVVCAAACWMLAISLCVADGAMRPNVVVILCDDLGIGDVHAFNAERGKIPTPCLDSLASQGMLFSDAHSPSAVCTPTRYGILTGRYCWRTRLQSGVLGGLSPPLIAPDRATVASFLKEQGYTTACIGKWHLGLAFGPQRYESPLRDGPLDHGFDHFFGISASLDMPPFAWIEDSHFLQPPNTTKTFLRAGPAAADFEAVDVMPALTTKAVDYIHDRSEKTDQPFFLYLAFTAPHTPIVPTPEWQGKSGLGDYGDFVMQTDAAIGAVVDAIDTSGYRDNTIIIVASDNGFAPAVGPHELESQGHFPSAEYRGYKSDIWEGGHRVPLIVRWPGVVHPGSASSELVELTDLFATVADILQVTLPDGTAEDSVSILPLLQGLDKPVRLSAILHSVFGRFAIRSGDWKLNLCAGVGRGGAHRMKPAQLRSIGHGSSSTTSPTIPASVIMSLPNTRTSSDI